MEGYIILTVASVDCGPFDLYSDVDGFVEPYDTGLSRVKLMEGHTSSLVPDGTTVVRTKSTGVCNGTTDIILQAACFKFSPEAENWMINFIDKGTGGLYYYGHFTGYTYGANQFESVRLLKLNENLTIDKSWLATTGLNQVYYGGSSIVEQPDGKIIATGTFTNYKGVSANRIVRINADGTRDTDFVVGTGFNGFTQTVAIDSLGRILVAGLFSSYNENFNNRLARILPNGSLDSSFVTGSGFNNTTTGILINPDDSMFVTGYFGSYNGVATSGGFIKINANGVRDTAFISGAGFSPAGNNNPQYMIRTPGETSFYVYGYFTTYKGVADKYLIKLNMDGTKDTSFVSGTGFNALIWLGHVVFGNKLLVSGNFTTYNGVPTLNHAVLNADGSLFYAFVETDGTNYNDAFTIGNKLYGSISGKCLKLLYTYIE